MKKNIIFLMTLLLMLGCETGVHNKGTNTNTDSDSVLSGIVDRSDAQRSNPPSSIQKSQKKTSNKIFSKTAQPGYYLQFAYFSKNKPNKAFLNPLEKAGLAYIVLAKQNGWYVLIGPSISYNTAKERISLVKSKLNKQTFVVQVLRP